MLTIQRY